jgi:hypothetical protein
MSKKKRKKKGVPHKPRKRPRRHPLTASDAAELLNLLSGKEPDADTDPEEIECLTWDPPQSTRDPRDPYGRTRATLLSILLDEADPTHKYPRPMEHELMHAYVDSHPEFPALYEALLNTGIRPDLHSNDKRPIILRFLTEQP